MDLTHWTLIDIVGPLLLLVALIWLVTRRRSARTVERSEQATKTEYADEEQRRRDGTDL